VAQVVDLGMVNPYRGDHRKLAFREREIVLDLAVHHDHGWDDGMYQRELLRRLRGKRSLDALGFIHGHYGRGYKADDPNSDGIMGWITKEREVDIGWMWGPAIAEVGLPPKLHVFRFADGGLDGASVAQIVGALPASLEVLDLADNLLGTEGIAALCAAKLPALKSIRVGWPGLDTAALRERFGDKLEIAASTRKPAPYRE
jgi:hypothetical protein